MGSRYVDAVLYGLEGRELSLPNGKSGKSRKLNAADMAFLLTIAARQPNPTTNHHSGLNPVCYGSPEALQRQMHLKKSAFFTTRQYLLNLGLITFSTEERLPDPKSDASKRFTNIYRINLAKLREFYPDINVWKNKILHIKDGEDVSRDVLRALMALDDANCPLRKTDSTVHETDSTVRNQDNPVRLTDSKTKNITKEQHQQTKPGSGDVEKAHLDRVVSKIANRLNISPDTINRSVVASAIKGKTPDTVYKAINDAQGIKQVGGFINRLRNIPLKEDDAKYKEYTQPTVEQILSNENSKDVQCLAETALKKIPNLDGPSLLIIMNALRGHVGDSDKNEIAVNLIDEFKSTSNEPPQMAAKRLADELTSKLK